VIFKRIVRDECYLFLIDGYSLAVWWLLLWQQTT